MKSNAAAVSYACRENFDLAFAKRIALADSGSLQDSEIWPRKYGRISEDRRVFHKETHLEVTDSCILLTTLQNGLQ